MDNNVKKCPSCGSTKVELPNGADPILNFLWFPVKVYAAIITLFYWDWVAAIVQKIRRKDYTWVCARLMRSSCGVYRCTECNKSFASFLTEKDKQKQRQIQERVVSTAAIQEPAVSQTMNSTPKAPPKKARCPKCHGTNIEPIGQKRKSFSVGKAAVGAVVFTPIAGVATGMLGGNSRKIQFYCRDCGNIFKRK